MFKTYFSFERQRCKEKVSDTAEQKSLADSLIYGHKHQAEARVKPGARGFNPGPQLWESGSQGLEPSFIVFMGASAWRWTGR